jgi:hypothetical protein
MGGRGDEKVNVLLQSPIHICAHKSIAAEAEAEAGEAANFQIETIDRKNDLHIKWGLQSSQQREKNSKLERLNVRMLKK